MTAGPAGTTRFRAARPGDGAALYRVTHRSIEGLAGDHYTPAQLAGWMGQRTHAFYEEIIARGGTVVAERGGEVASFVDAEPGEILRLFILPGAAGAGLGSELLKIGLEVAMRGHRGPIRLESTLNAQGFYKRHGFRAVERSTFSHGLGGDPIEVVLMEMPAPPT